MDHTDDAAKTQQGIDPLASGALTLPPAMPAGWAAVPVKSLRNHGASLAAIGLAAAMILRDQGASTEEKIRAVYGLEKLAGNKLLRELVIAGFLEFRGELYHVSAGGQG